MIRFLTLVGIFLLLFTVNSFGFLEIINLKFDDEISFLFKIPRTLVASIVGGCLAIAGLNFQGLFRNDLATPYTLGISSGASLGAAISFYLGLNFVFLYAFDSAAIFSFLGALSTVLVILSIGFLKKQFKPEVLLLSGVAIGICCSSLILSLQFLMGEMDGMRIVQWMMGSLSVVGHDQSIQLLALIFLPLAYCVYSIKDFNLLSVSDSFALSRGVNIDVKRINIFIATSLLIAPTIAVCGPIGFVGLIVPHIMKKQFGRNYKILYPTCFIGGASFLIFCDIISRSLESYGLIPLGVVTGMIGGPFFILCLFKKI